MPVALPKFVVFLGFSSRPKDAGSAHTRRLAAPAAAERQPRGSSGRRQGSCRGRSLVPRPRAFSSASLPASMISSEFNNRGPKTGLVPFASPAPIRFSRFLVYPILGKEKIKECSHPRLGSLRPALSAFPAQPCLCPRTQPDLANVQNLHHAFEVSHYASCQPNA